MANIAIIPKPTPFSGITVANAATNFPKENLGTKQPSEKWRSTNLTSIFIEASSADLRPIDLIALIGTNMTANATYRIRAATTQANLTASPGYDSSTLNFMRDDDMRLPASNADWIPPALPGWSEPSLFHWMNPAQSFLWWRIDLTDGANPDGYMQAGRLLIGSAWQPTRNLNFDWSIGWESDTDLARALGGQTYHDKRAGRRVVNFNLDFSSQDEMLGNAFQIDRLYGTADECVVMVNPEIADHLHKLSVYGYLSQATPIVNPAFDLYSKVFRLTELI